MAAGHGRERGSGAPRKAGALTVAPPATLPRLEWQPSRAFSSRNGFRPQLVVVHRWGGGSLQGVESWFDNPSHQVSSHLVYAGEHGPNAGRCAQLVHLADKAWTEAAWNEHSVSIECADAVWVGDDEAGRLRVARIVAWLLHHLAAPPTWCYGRDLLTKGTGFCRHADLGVAGGGHLQCPTTDVELWLDFCESVLGEYLRGGFRSHWAR